MRRQGIIWTIFLVLLVVAAIVVYWNRGAMPIGSDMSSLESSLVAGRCSKAEAVDRWLLQQSWFHDRAFTRLAVAFGQRSFVIYEEQAQPVASEGVFCISGTDLMIRYYERSYVVDGVSLSPLSVSYGVKLRPLGEDVYSIRELTKERMIVVFASDAREHVFYRKN